MSLYERLSLLIQAVIGLAALYFAWRQTQINERLRRLQDVVTLSIVPGKGTFNIINAGTRSVYLHRFEVASHSEAISPPRLISAGTGDSSYYWVPPPKGLEEGEDFELKFYLIDEDGQKWVTEGAGTVLTVKTEKKGDKLLYAIQTFDFSC